MSCSIAKQNAPEDKRSIEEDARNRLTEGSDYGFYLREIRCHYDKGVLRLYGRVPSFYLKQVIQTRLRGLPGVVEIDNQVDVINSCGLSSVRSP
jgi:osmotically-inducible protein OsmY